MNEEQVEKEFERLGLPLPKLPPYPGPDEFARQVSQAVEEGPQYESFYTLNSCTSDDEVTNG